MDKEEAGVETNDSQSAAESTEVEVEAGAPAAEQGEPDWEAIAAKERDRAENYKKAFTQKREFVKAAKKVEADDVDEDAPLTRKELRRVLQEEVVPVVAENRVDMTLKELIKDPSKREAVKAIYDNRIRQTGTSDEAVRQDIEAALSIADGHKLRTTNAELTRKANQQQTPILSGSASDRGMDKKNHKFSDEQIKNLTATANRLGADPKAFIEKTWKNQQQG